MFWSDRSKFYKGLHPKDVQALEEVAEALGEALRNMRDRIDALEAEVAALKKEPRQSLKAKLREKGIT